MLDAGPFYGGPEVVAHLILIMTGAFSSEEGGNLIRLHGMNGRPCENTVDRFQMGLLPESRF